MPYNPQNIAALLAQMPDAFTSLQQGLKTGMMPREMQLRQAQEQRAAEMQPLKEALLRAQAQKALQPQSPQSSLGKLMADRLRAQQSGASQESLQQYDQAIANVAQGRQGIVVTDPKTGQEMIRIGGPASSRGTDGGVYQSGDEQVSTVTKPTKTSLEKSLIAADQVDRLAKNIVNISNTKGWFNKAMNMFEKFSNEYLGGNYDNPSDIQYVQSSIKTMTEPLIREMGLNATDKTIAEVNSILQPQWGESSDGYKKRITKQLHDYSTNNKGKTDFLFEGVRRKSPQADKKESSIDYGSYSPADIKYTAKVNNMTEQQVLDFLRKKNA